jgi:hypothetical protein
MDLLRAHKILIVFTILLGFALVAWGVVHGLYRHEPDAYGMLVLGGMAWPIAAMYLIHLYRNPPIH